MRRPIVSVLMPTYGQAHFLPRAVHSLQGQELTDWELIIVDDGSPDDTYGAAQPFLADPRIHYHRLERNRGLGAALNCGLGQARAPLIAYLPSDDVFYAEHLTTLARCLEDQPGAILAYSGVRHHYNRWAAGQIAGFPLQLVQVMHRLTPDRWVEREELVTDDLHRMFWGKFGARGEVVGTGRISGEWVDHPDQLHKLLQEPEGGINPYRARFNVRHPLSFHSTVGNRIDEVEHYRQFRERPDTPPAKDGLKILLVGELAYNPERILALEERGHQLCGLWMPDPYWYNTVGPLPFGHVRDLPRCGWREAVRELEPDLIYALLNWQAVPFAHEVLVENPGVPFIWHHKEGPFICLEKGSWAQLIDLYTRADGRIFSSPEMAAWFETVVPDSKDCGPLLCLDGDLPKREWFEGEPSPRLSERDGQIHTVVTGRPIGLSQARMAVLGAQGIHVHLYGDYTHGQWHAWIADVMELAPDYLHLHANVDQDDWVTELSQYDAGWLHFFASENQGDLRRATWDDLNYPARMGTFAAAGLPMLQADNSGALVATQTLAQQLDLSVFFSDVEELGDRLRDRASLDPVRASVWRNRECFTFDHHADRLIDFFRRVIDGRGSREPQYPSLVDPGVGLKGCRPGE